VKLNYAADNVQIFGGEDDTTNYTIQGSAKMFQILSSGVYSDKILAVVREISCNAYDSHIQANNVKTPIDVHMPTSWENWFAVRDYGVGMSEETIKKVYTSYGNSTKTDSNEMTGALGIGSKSPFAYTKSFTITSIFDGIKSVYSAYIGDDYKPKLLKMTSVETTENNGVEIKVPVEATDRYKFVEAGSKVYRWFDTKPKLNVTIDIHDPLAGLRVLSDKDGMKITYSVNSCAHWAKQGTVAYPVNVANFRHLLSDNVFSAMTYTSTVVEFDMGQLDITASREALSYDIVTQQNLADKYEKRYNELIAEILTNLGNEQYYFDCVLNYQTNREFYNRIGVTKNYIHKKSGRVATERNVNLGDLVTKIVTKAAVPPTVTTPLIPEEWHYNAEMQYGYYRSNKFKVAGYGNSGWNYVIDNVPTKIFIVDGNLKLSENQIAGRIQTAMGSDYIKFYVMRVAIGQNAANFKTEIDKLIDASSSVVIEVGSLPKYVTQRAAYTKTTYAASVFTTYNNEWAKETVVESVVPNTKTYYMDISMAGRDKFKHMNIERFVSAMITLHKHAYPNIDIRVVGLNKNQAKNLGATWENLEEHAVNIVQDFRKIKAASIAMREYYHKYDQLFNSHLLNTHTTHLWNFIVKYAVNGDLLCADKIDKFVNFCNANAISNADHDKYLAIKGSSICRDVVFDNTDIDNNHKLIHDMYVGIPKLPKLASMINNVVDKDAATELVQFLNLYMK